MDENQLPAAVKNDFTGDFENINDGFAERGFPGGKQEDRTKGSINIAVSDGVVKMTFFKSGNTILEQLRKQRENGLFLDMRLKIINSSGVETIAVHKCVMAAVSRYIYDNGQQSEIDLTRVSAESVTCLVKWAYSGALEIKESYCQDLLVISEFLCIDEVFQECVDYYCDRLNPENCCNIYNIASSFQTFNFANRVRKYLLANFCILIRNNNLKTLSKEDFFSLVTDENFIVTSEKGFPVDEEEEMLNLMYSYLKDRNAYDLWPEILENVLRLCFLSSVKLEDMIKNSKSWLGNCSDEQKCLDLLKSVLISKKSNSLSVQNLNWTKSRKGLQNNLEYKWTDVFAFQYPRPPCEDKFNDVELILDELKSDGLQPLIYVTGMRLHSAIWDNRIVIGGLEVTYNNNKTIAHGDNNYGEKIDEFKLNWGERITHIIVRSGWLIDGIQFETSSGRKLGHYGGACGTEYQIKSPNPGAYLAGIKGQTSISQGSSLVRKLCFAWCYINNK